MIYTWHFMMLSWKQVVGGDVYTGVESLALELYASEEHGGYWGLHDEGVILRTLFGLLFWYDTPPSHSKSGKCGF
jgi:hypothetical protein